MKHRLLFFLCVASWTANSQTIKNTVSGTIKDALSGETLIGTTVRVKELVATGTSANEYGFYSLTLPAAKYTLVIQCIGYQEDSLVIDLNHNMVKNISLRPAESMLQEVEVSANKQNDNITNAQTGMEKMDIKEISKIPVLFGEKDIIKTMQL